MTLLPPKKKLLRLLPRELELPPMLPTLAPTMAKRLQRLTVPRPSHQRSLPRNKRAPTILAMTHLRRKPSQPRKPLLRKLNLRRRLSVIARIAPMTVIMLKLSTEVHEIVLEFLLTFFKRSDYNFTSYAECQ